MQLNGEGGKTTNAPWIVIDSGARSLVPPIPGLHKAGFLENVSLLKLDSLPKNLIIIGAEYMSCEFGHFFSALGTQVTILGHGSQVLSRRDPPGSETALQLRSAPSGKERHKDR